MGHPTFFNCQTFYDPFKRYDVIQCPDFDSTTGLIALGVFGGIALLCGLGCALYCLKDHCTQIIHSQATEKTKLVAAQIV